MIFLLEFTCCGFFTNFIIIFSRESTWGKQNLETLELTKLIIFLLIPIPVNEFSTFLFLVKYSNALPILKGNLSQ